MPREKPLVTQGLGEQLYDIILGRILEGRLRPGERLVPSNLRTTFGVSITPVRDALQQLKRAGFVQVRPREGVTVSVLDAKRARDVLDMRIALEMLAARNAATTAPPDELQGLARRFRDADARLTANGGDRVLEPIDWALHELVVRYADNTLLQEALRTIHHHVQWVGGIAGIGARRIRESFGEHKEILKALLQRDPEAAGEAMRRHLTSTKTTVLRYLEGLSGVSRNARTRKGRRHLSQTAAVQPPGPRRIARDRRAHSHREETVI
jgi:DNA-binding GntR family transcriptional regulator